MKNASAFGSSKSQMLPSLLPFPASFFKVLPLPQKFNRFHIPGSNKSAKYLKKKYSVKMFYMKFSCLTLSED